MQLSEVQLRAVSMDDGPAMILAGPGSGKTLVITNRVRYLIQERHIAPEEILVITFSKAAAVLMRRRFEQMMNARVTFGTFHSVFFHILKSAYHYTSDNILREREKTDLIWQLADRFQLETGDEQDLTQRLAEEISLVKNEKIRIEDYYASCCPEEIFREIYVQYHQILSQKRKIDFDDMLVYCLELFRQRPDILSLWQKRFRYICVDEFQDINALQYEIVRLLAGGGHHLFVVGDDDQSIYRFRGARPRIMLGFRKDYPECSLMVLNENYRSTKAIVNASCAVIGQNRERFAKDLKCMGEEGEAVDLRYFRNVQTQTLYLVNTIRESHEKGCPWSQIAVFTRTAFGGEYIAQKLMEFDIPVTFRDSMPCLYDHWAAEDILAYLRISWNCGSRRDWLRIMNRPLRYLSRECIGSDPVTFDDLLNWYQDKPWMMRRIEEMEEQILNLKRFPPFAAINYICKGIGYEGYLKEYAERRRIRPEDLLRITDELMESARPYKTIPEWLDAIETYRKSLLMKKKEKALQEQQGSSALPDQVTLSTLHSSKGLEYEEVFLPDLNEEIIPHRKAFLQEDIEEERRLLYVGMTRAKKRLHMSYVGERFGRVSEPSRFLEILLP